MPNVIVYISDEAVEKMKENFSTESSTLPLPNVTELLCAALEGSHITDYIEISGDYPSGNIFID